ncbi:MAG: hypothetical protein U0T36_05120 [Saprospiraceae bacterium]
MKFLIVLLATLFGINAGVNGQKNSPVKWSFELNKVSDQEYQIHGNCQR